MSCFYIIMFKYYPSEKWLIFILLFQVLEYTALKVCINHFLSKQLCDKMKEANIHERWQLNKSAEFKMVLTKMPRSSNLVIKL